MENTCICCKNNVEDFLSVKLTDAHICGECFRKVNAKKERITRRNIGMYSAEEIMNILNSVEETSHSEVSPSPTEKIPEKIESVQTIPNDTNDSSDNSSSTSGTIFGTIKKIGWTILAILVVISLINPEFPKEIAKKLIGANDSMYIEMVQTLKPFNSTSYYEAFESEFDNNEWSYFKSGEKQIVQVVSTYNDIEEKMTVQFLLTPQGNDQFYIEPYAINVGGRNLTTLEITMVMSRIFQGDLSDAIFNTLLYGN